jgi:hypothetical protein
VICTPLHPSLRGLRSRPRQPITFVRRRHTRFVHPGSSTQRFQRMPGTFLPSTVFRRFTSTAGRRAPASYAVCRPLLKGNPQPTNGIPLIEDGRRSS